MPVLEKDMAKDLKARIFDLDEKALKQVLFGMVEILSQHPSVLLGVFLELVCDGLKYSEVIKSKEVKK